MDTNLSDFYVILNNSGRLSLIYREYSFKDMINNSTVATKDKFSPIRIHYIRSGGTSNEYDVVQIYRLAIKLRNGRVLIISFLGNKFIFNYKNYIVSCYLEFNDGEKIKGIFFGNVYFVKIFIEYLYYARMGKIVTKKNKEKIRIFKESETFFQEVGEFIVKSKRWEVVKRKGVIVNPLKTIYHTCCGFWWRIVFCIIYVFYTIFSNINKIMMDYLKKIKEFIINFIKRFR